LPSQTYIFDNIDYLILQELSNRFSINEKSLFQDIYGFSMVNDVNHPIYENTIIAFKVAVYKL
jgi:hypothetical protein